MPNENKITEEITKLLLEFDTEGRKSDELWRILEDRTMSIQKSADGNKKRVSLPLDKKLDFLRFAKKSNFSPFTELWACYLGGILRPYILIDGWFSVLQRHIASGYIRSVKWAYSDIANRILGNNREIKTYEWVEITLVLSDGREFPYRATLYDNFSDTDTWRKYAGKMLQNKAIATALRMYVGNEGSHRIYDDDEIRKISENEDMFMEEPKQLQKSSQVIKTLKSFENIKTISLVGETLMVKALMEASTILKQLGFKYSRDNASWTMQIALDNEIETRLVKEGLFFETRKGKGTGKDKVFYKVVNPSSHQEKFLLENGFRFVNKKGFIKAV